MNYKDQRRIINKEITLLDLVIEKEKEIEKLNNIINSIEKFLKDNIEYLDNFTEMQSRIDEDREIIRYIHFLKGDDKE